MKRLNHIFKSAILCAVSVALLTSGTPVSGEYKFREFSDDRSRFERYVEEAGKETTAEEWQGIIDSGREEMKASWEQAAEDEVRRYVLGGGDEGEVRESLEEAKAGWERSFEAEGAIAKGAWYLQRENLTSPVIDLQGLKERITSAKGDNSIDTVEEWDAYIGSVLESSDSRWNSDLNTILETARQKGAALSAWEKAGFEKELAEFEKRQKESFSLERDSVLYLGRNSFITEKFIDTDSLRSKSEAESAEAITDNVIQGVENDISREEGKILNRSFSGDGSETINFSNMGDNWQEELKKLIETGMSKWNAAREKLYNEMINWKNSAQEAFDNIEAKWRLGLEKLEQARGEWERKLSEEIYKGLEEWQREREDLEDNIAAARRDLSGYMENMNSQWSDHSQGLIDMAVNGSQVYTEALVNIKWLEDNVEKYKNQPAFTAYDERLNTVLENDTSAAGIQVQSAINEMKAGGFNIDLIKVKPVLLSMAYDSNTGVYTEKYRLDLIYYLPPSDWFPAGFEWPYKSLNWDNVVTKDTTDANRKSTYYYYASELQRWRNIRDSFKGIAGDAEFYMHERNMLGQEGPGYLRNSGGEYGANNTDNAGDPYLLTGAEYNLELASRDRDFWQRRLDIARAVLDYAEQGKREGAVATEKGKADAEAAMKEAKTAYQNAVSKVQDIVTELKKKQQCTKPSTEYDPLNVTPEWKAYLGSLDYLTNEFNEANKVLAVATEKYDERKRSLIIMENGEDAEYLKKEIEQIEINMLKSESELFEKRTEFFRTQREGEYAERTEGFAQRYESAVKSYEDSKWRLNEFSAVVIGTESDDNLEKWAADLSSDETRNKIWKNDADANAAFIQALLGEFRSADSFLKSDKREKLSFYIRGLYFSLREAVKRDLSIINILRDNNFNPDSFLSSGQVVNHEIYKRYADISVNALNIIKGAFEWAEEDNSRKNYDSMATYLKGLSADKQYTYGADNSLYIAHYTALKLFKDRYRGLTPEAWAGSRNRLDDDISYSEKASELHDEISGMSGEDLASLALSHETKATGEFNMDSVAWLREYYLTGSGIAGIEYITSLDRENDVERLAYNETANFVIENERYFSREQELLKTHDYLNDVLGFIQSRVSIAAGGGENGLSMDMLKSLSPENMSTAVGAIREYIENLEKNGVSVPDFIRSAALNLEQLKQKLDSELFILGWMKGDSGMDGTPDEIYSERNADYVKISTVTEFVKRCGDYLESGADDISASIAILNTYEGLTDDAKRFINENADAGIRKFSGFISSLYSRRSELMVSRIAADFEKTESSVTPDQYISLISGLSDQEKISLLNQLKPVYERRLYDRDYADGKVTGIDAYLAGRSLSGDEAALLRNYALINEYRNILKGSSSSGKEPVFSEYILHYGLENFIKGIVRDEGESESDYIARCASGYASSKGITDPGKIDDFNEFTENFITGDISSIAYLPEEAKIFAASQYYYDEIFSKNKVLKSGIDEFLESKYGEESIDSTLVEAVEKYASRLNAVSLYFGQNFENYLSWLSGDVKQCFLMYVYGERSAILPGFEYGIYGRNSVITATGLVLQGTLGRELDSFYSEYPSVSSAIGRICDEAEDKLRNASALKEFIAGGGDNKNWRGSIIAIADPGEDNKQLIFREEVSETTGWIDYSDPEGSVKNHVKFAGEITRDNIKFSLNGIVDSMNKIYSVFDSLGRVMPVESAGDWTGGIGEFLTRADAVYNMSVNYGKLETGEFSFESALRDIASYYETKSSDYSSSLDILAGDIQSRESSVEATGDALVSKKGSYDIFGGDKNMQLAELDKLRTEHEAAKQKVNGYRGLLAAAREEYEGINTRYVKQMNMVSTSYAEYKSLESGYEKAYAVWEYANTPYLKESDNNDGGLVSGDIPGEDTLADFTKLEVPDARENYQRIEKIFNEKEADYKNKAAAVANQETVEKLNEDREYAELKADFTRKSQTYIRTAQVDAELGETLNKYQSEFEQSKKLFDISRDAVKFYSEIEKNVSAEQREVLRIERDKILSHIAMYSVNRYMQAMALYSSYRAITGGARGDLFSSNINEYYSYLSLPPDIKSDMEILNADFRKIPPPTVTEPDENTSDEESDSGGGSIADTIKTSSIANIFDNYQMYRYYALRADKAWSKYKHTSKLRYFTRRSRKREAEKLRNKRDNFYTAYYYSGVDPIKKTLNDYIARRGDLEGKSAALNGISSVKELSALKTYIGIGSNYKLDSEDLSHLYDTTSEGFIVDGESVNLNSLRKEVQRLDIDGDAVRAVYRNGKVVVLDKDGKELTDAKNVYDLTNPGIRLKSGGEAVETYVEGEVYDLYDCNFNIKEVTAVMKDLADRKRNEYYGELMTYVQKSAAGGKHDYTVMLRDLESTFHGLQEYAAGFNFNAADPKGEKKQRGFDGYVNITRDYVNNGKGTSIEDLIVKELMKQNMGLQEKLWAQQRSKFSERETRWREVTGYILNRGNRDWRIKYSDYLAEWKKWRYEANNDIESGNKWWTDRDAEMQAEMKTWSEDTSKASSKAAVEKIYSELAGKVESYEKNIRKNMPGYSFDIDTDRILTDTMRNIPLDSIGILSKSMFASDTTAGYSNVLSLGLSSSLFKYNEQKMAEYQEAVGVMKNLQVIDILNGIIENFNKQLLEANESVYESFGGFATEKDIISAPFVRNKEENVWSIRVCAESTLMGDKYKTRRFRDYSYFINQTVFLQPLKGLGGTTIDFTNAGSYANLDGGDLETYVGLESELLRRKIEEVFKNPTGEDTDDGGLFSQHIDKEQERLGEEFKDKYTEWMEGEAMRGMAAWNKPIGHCAPSVAVTVNIGAQAVGAFLGGSAGAAVGQLAASTLFTGLDVADGTVSWQQAGAQFGVGFASQGAGMFAPLVNGAAQGIEYKEGGRLGWSEKDFEAGLKSGSKEMVIRGLTGNTPIFSDFMVSYLGTDGGWGDWNFDNQNWGDHIIAGINGGLGYAGTAGQLIGEGIRTFAYNMTDGKGFEDRDGVNENQYNWNMFRPDAKQMGSAFAKVLPYLLDDEKDESKDKKSDTTDPIEQAETYLGGLWVGNRSWQENMSSVFKGMSGDLGKDLGNAASEIAEGDIIGLIGGGISREFNETVQGILKIAGGLGKIGSAIGDAWDSSLETIKGWFGGGNEKTQPEKDPHLLVLQHQIDQKMKEYREGTITREQLEKKLAEYENRIAAIENDAASAKKDKKGEWYTTFKDSKEAVDYIQTKKDLGLPITEEDRELLARTLWQAKDKPLSNEVKDMISANKELFRKVLGSKVDDPAAVAAFADKFSSKSCVLNVLFMNIITSSLKDGTPASFSDMYLKLMKEGKIQEDGISLKGSINDLNNLQSIVNSIVGVNKLKVEGYSIDQGLSSKQVYNKFFEVLQNSSVLNIGGRISGHSIYLYNQGDTWGEYDTGRPGKRSPRPYGKSFRQDFNLENVSSLYWLTQY